MEGHLGFVSSSCVHLEKDISAHSSLLRSSYSVKLDREDLWTKFQNLQQILN